MASGYLLVDEGVKIENDSLQMNDQYFWRLANSCLLRYIDFFVAKAAFEIANQLSWDVPAKRIT